MLPALHVPVADRTREAGNNADVRVLLDQWATREGLLFGRKRGRELGRRLRGQLARLSDPQQLVFIDFVGVRRVSLPLLRELFAYMHPVGYFDEHPIHLVGVTGPVDRALQALFEGAVTDLYGSSVRSEDPVEARGRPSLNRRVPLELFVDRHGVLSSVAAGWEARTLVETQAATALEEQPLTLDFLEVSDLTASFAAEGLIEPMARLGDAHPFVIANANKAIERFVAATVGAKQRMTLLNPGEPPRSLGESGQRLDEVRALADAMSPFAVSELAEALALSPEAANYHVRRLVDSGFLSRERRGGKGEPYRYFVAEGSAGPSA